MDDLPSNCSSQGHSDKGRALARLAGRQYGVVSLGQLEALGLAGSTVRSRVAAGRSHRLHRGVYAVGHATRPPRRDG